MSTPAIPLWCLLIAALMPYFILALAKSSKTYDNEDPRNMAGFQSPLQRRAHAAHQNAFEALGLFTAAVLAALFQHAAPATLSTLCVLWVLLRLVYFVIYLTGQGTLRSIVWSAATLTSIAIFLAAIFH
jgi:uncharacterized MAPEG superfamily protein